MRIYLFIFSCILGFTFSVMAQSAGEASKWKTSWEKMDVQRASPEALLHLYRENQENTGKLFSEIRLRQEAGTENDCWFVLKTGQYFLLLKGKVEEQNKLLEVVPDLSLSAPEVIRFMKQVGEARFTDAYYLLKTLKRGATFDEARDGIEPTTAFPGRPLNRYDQKKLQDIFEGQNEELKIVYLQKLKSVFRHAGCTRILADLRPFIEKEVADGKVKQEVAELYARYESLMPGKPAPLSLLKDTAGNTYSWTGFKGKVIVADVWATWCCECIERIPHFLKLREKWSGRDDVIFLSVSIDRQEELEKWKKAIVHQGMQPMLNLVATAGKTSFETDYAIVSVPRYLIIDKEGNLIDAFAPSAGPEMEEKIRNALK